MTIPKRPNVLFVITDQQRADHVGFGGNQVVQTPNLDGLAARSTVFDRAFVSNPVCMPNRSTIMTGRMPSAHGVIFNDRSLSPDANTFVRQLRHAGYRTALIGKSHLQHGMSRDALVDLPGHPGMATPWAEGWDTVEHQERYEGDHPPDPDDFYGFGHIELTLGHGSGTGGHHYRWARERGATHDQLTAGFLHDSDVPNRSPIWWQIHEAPYPAEVYSTTFVTERTIDFIEGAEQAGGPWMAWCSFPDPHHPLAPPREWLHRHAADDMALPSTYDDPGEGWPFHMTVLRGLPPHDEQFVRPFGPTPGQTRASIAATYGMIEFIDDGVGRILAALDRLGIADDTIIVFTSDHGDMMGDHGMILKGAMHYEGCVRVPMVLHTPGRKPSRTDSLASSIDLPHTLLELCGVGEYQGMQGHSLTPILDDPSISVRDHVLVEDDFPPAVVGPGLPLKTRTVITESVRYTRDIHGQEQLFDLAADPDEMVDLSEHDRDPARRAEMTSLLADALIAADDLTRPEPVSH
ncbi:MAG TPA: sulfatase-like hydrolase/transferase [Acidimicrobiales bacterium]|nr:sulfatase-like hydrolase/transferase [Acidimicrobiales bacterium]